MVNEPGDCVYLDEILTDKPAKYRLRTVFPSTMLTCSLFDLIKQIFPGFENIDETELGLVQQRLESLTGDHLERCKILESLDSMNYEKLQRKNGGFFRYFTEYNQFNPDTLKEFDLYVNNVL